MKIKLVIILFFFSMLQKLFAQQMLQKLCAQQDPMYSMYLFDKLLINPAYAGSSNWVVATLKHRDQFTGIKGHPKTQTFNIHGPIQKKHIGLGLKVINDKVALMSNLNLTGQISYHLNFAGGKLSAGIEAGIYSRRVNYQELIVNTKNDNSIPTVAASSMVPDASFGLYYQKKQSYLGFSNYHLFKKSFDHSSSAHLYKHVYFIAGNTFDVTKKISVEPSLLLKYQAKSALQLDLNVMAYYNDLIGAGLQLRTKDALVAMLKVNITEGLRIAYSYDMTISKLAPYAKGAHEIVISYGIKLPPPPTQKEIHPRYYF
jgi:type IX secretion system PorP/SprF family membrane protein